MNILQWIKAIIFFIPYKLHKLYSMSDRDREWRVHYRDGHITHWLTYAEAEPLSVIHKGTLIWKYDLPEEDRK